MMVELLTGGLFAAAAYRFGIGVSLLPALALLGFLIPLTFIDLEHWLLPFELTLPGTVAGLFLSFLGPPPRFQEAVIGVGVALLGFWALEHVGRAAFKKEALGGGDKYLLALIAALLGYRSLLGVVLLSSLQGSIVGVALLAVRGRAGPAPVAPEEISRPASTDAPLSPASAAPEPPTEADEEEDDWQPGPTNMPFGPWLALSAVEVLLLGSVLSELLPENLAWLLFGAQGGA
jgi:leader peptidase (prepilin peptidase)/N-methyltransferase